MPPAPKPNKQPKPNTSMTPISVNDMGSAPSTPAAPGQSEHPVIGMLKVMAKPVTFAFLKKNLALRGVDTQAAVQYVLTLWKKNAIALWRYDLIEGGIGLSDETLISLVNEKSATPTTNGHINRGVRVITEKMSIQKPLSLSPGTRANLGEVQKALGLQDLDAAVVVCAALGATLLEYLNSNGTDRWLTLVDHEMEQQVSVLL